MSRAHRIPDEKILAVTSWRESTVFDEVEKAVLAYAEEMTREHVDVPDALFDTLRSHFDEAQLVELTACIAWENYRARFNHALGIGSGGLSEGAACAVPWNVVTGRARDAASG